MTGTDAVVARRDIAVVSRPRWDVVECYHLVNSNNVSDKHKPFFAFYIFFERKNNRHGEK